VLLRGVVQDGRLAVLNCLEVVAGAWRGDPKTRCLHGSDEQALGPLAVVAGDIDTQRVVDRLDDLDGPTVYGCVRQRVRCGPGRHTTHEGECAEDHDEKSQHFHSSLR
jgi:hypothetical protein